MFMSFNNLKDFANQQYLEICCPLLAIYIVIYILKYQNKYFILVMKLHLYIRTVHNHKKSGLLSKIKLRIIFSKLQTILHLLLRKEAVNKEYIINKCIRRGELILICNIHTYTNDIHRIIVHFTLRKVVERGRSGK